MSTMSDPKCTEKDMPDSLSNRDAIELPDALSLSDSDPDEPNEHFGRNVEDLSSSSEDEEDAQHDQPVPQKNPTFRLTGGSSGFFDRSKDIFAQLDSAAKLTSKHLGEDNVLDGTFARPAPPSPPQAVQRKCGADPDATRKQPSGKKLPDYLAHPQRWTRYSLEDVPETSDRKNSQVAHQYIQGLQDKKRSQDAVPSTFSPAFNQDHDSSCENKIMFTKPKSKDPRDNKPDVRKEEVGLQHLDDRQENEGEAAPLHHLSSRDNKKKKRKWTTEEEKDEDKMVTNVVFNTGKKVNRKHIRKTLGEDAEGTE